VWIHKGKTQRETLCYLSDLENKRAKLDESKAQAVKKLIKVLAFTIDQMQTIQEATAAWI